MWCKRKKKDFHIRALSKLWVVLRLHPKLVHKAHYTFTVGNGRNKPSVLCERAYPQTSIDLCYINHTTRVKKKPTLSHQGFQLGPRRYEINVSKNALDLFWKDKRLRQHSVKSLHSHPSFASLLSPSTPILSTHLRNPQCSLLSLLLPLTTFYWLKIIKALSPNLNYSSSTPFSYQLGIRKGGSPWSDTFLSLGIKESLEDHPGLRGRLDVF